MFLGFNWRKTNFCVINTVQWNKLILRSNIRERTPYELPKLTKTTISLILSFALINYISKITYYHIQIPFMIRLRKLTFKSRHRCYKIKVISVK